MKHWPTWMPFSFYQKHAAYTKKIVEKLFTLPLEFTETQMVCHSIILLTKLIPQSIGEGGA